MEKLKRSLSSFAVPLLSILLAFLIGGIIMAALGADPFAALKYLFQGAFGSRANIGTTLSKSTPLMFTALCACFAYKCGVFNLGGEGQFLMGAMAAFLTAYFSGLTGFVGILLALLAGTLAGGLWGLIPGILKVTRGQNEMIISIMLNYVATLFMGVLYTSWIRDENIPQTPAISKLVQLPRVIANMRFTWGFVLALVVGVFSFNKMYAHAYVLSVDGVEVGVISTDENVDAIVANVESRAASILGEEYSYDGQIVVTDALVTEGEFDEASKVENAVFDSVGALTEAYAVSVDGVEMGYAPSLEELDALSALEPYGSGNARPVFCLLGATLLRTQNVGQNRHLKLRLGKGSAQFDGIFFSTVAEDCGCRVGDRVDAAFYLQVNEFRGSRTVQLQMVDLRPSLCASGREQESLTLADRCTARQPMPVRDARRLLPTRDQFAAAWRFLERTVPDGGLTTGYLPLLRALAAELGKTEPFPRAALCLSVFAERGLLTLERQGDDVTIRLHRGLKVVLGQSPCLLWLHEITEKGGVGQ